MLASEKMRQFLESLQPLWADDCGRRVLCQKRISNTLSKYLQSLCNQVGRVFFCSLFMDFENEKTSLDSNLICLSQQKFSPLTFLIFLHITNRHDDRLREWQTQRSGIFCDPQATYLSWKTKVAKSMIQKHSLNSRTKCPFVPKYFYQGDVCTLSKKCFSLCLLSLLSVTLEFYWRILPFSTL